jgi:hypothetical protein
VPADARLLEGDPIEVDQSALTGESLPATRKPGEAVFSGSIIRMGEIDALVYATGANTYFGKTAQLVQEAHTVSHFQRAVLKIGDYLIILAVALVAVILGVALSRGDRMLTTLQFALVLTVAAIPVAMPTVLSVTMAVGASIAKPRRICYKMLYGLLLSYRRMGMNRAQILFVLSVKQGVFSRFYRRAQKGKAERSLCRGIPNAVKSCDFLYPFGKFRKVQTVNNFLLPIIAA